MVTQMNLESPTFNRGVILVDEMALDQLNSQAGFADTTAAYNNELVLSQELMKGQQHDRLCVAE